MRTRSSRASTSPHAFITRVSKHTVWSSIIAAATQPPIYASTQGTFTIHGDAAKELGLAENAVTTTVEHMGGGFGSKFGLGLEGMLACRLSKKQKRR